MFGKDRVGIRLSPVTAANNAQQDSHPQATYGALIEALAFKERFFLGIVGVVHQQHLSHVAALVQLGLAGHLVRLIHRRQVKEEAGKRPVSKQHVGLALVHPHNLKRRALGVATHAQKLLAHPLRQLGREAHHHLVLHQPVDVVGPFVHRHSTNERTPLSSFAFFHRLFWRFYLSFTMYSMTLATLSVPRPVTALVTPLPSAPGTT